MRFKVIEVTEGDNGIVYNLRKVSRNLEVEEFYLAEQFAPSETKEGRELDVTISGYEVRITLI